MGWTPEVTERVMKEDPLLVAEIFGVWDGDAKVEEARAKERALKANPRRGR